VPCLLCSVEKTQHINARTKIHTRRFVQIITSPLLSGSNPPTIDAVNDVFMRLGVKMAVEAARTAIADWAGAAGDITHLLSSSSFASTMCHLVHAGIYSDVHLQRVPGL
jgi:predicted naringenin-chalcone synthase